MIKAGPFHFCQILGTVLNEATLEKAKFVMAQTCKNPAPACFDLEPEVFGRLIDLSLGLSFLE